MIDRIASNLDRTLTEKPVLLPHIIDMAHSTDRCHFVEGVTTDAQLGRFCAENIFVPEADDLSDEAFELLDFAKIGREFRQNEGGVLIAQGYVQRHDELRQVYGTLDLALRKPDYTILVETTSGCEVRLPLPLGETVVDEPVLCVDCAAPALIGMSGTMGTWDMLAHRLAALEVDGELPKYKALVEAVGCDDICRALSLADELNQYTYFPGVQNSRGAWPGQSGPGHGSGGSGAPPPPPEPVPIWAGAGRGERRETDWLWAY